MKKIGSVISVVASLAFSLNMFSASMVNAAQVGLYGLKNNCFLERDASYSFGLYSGSKIKDVQLKYHCQPIGGWNTNYTVNVASYNLSVPVFTFDQGEINTSFIQSYGPWYSSGLIGNKMEFIVTHPDGTTSNQIINCNVLDEETDWYDDRDTTFYYSNPDTNSFVSFKTGRVSQFSNAVYNCLSYAIHAESEGWLWPFGQQATNAAVVYYLYNRGYNQNTTSNHAFSHVIAYGTEQNNTLHFAKVTDWSSNGTPIEINSKWGGMEVIHSSSISPFTNSSSYGIPLMYFNKINNNTESIRYNSVTHTYYDSNYKTWNASTYSYDYIDVLSSSNVSSQNITGTSNEIQCSPELAQIYNRYKEKIEEYINSIPDYNSISYIITDDETGAADELITDSLQYWDEIVDIATKGGYENFDSRTAQFIITNTLKLNVLYSTPDKYLADIKNQLKSALDAVNQIDTNFSEDDYNKLKSEYGYLIAPALDNIGKLDYISIEKDDYCKSGNELLELCNSFE